MKISSKAKALSIWDKGNGDRFLQEQLEALDLRDNMPPQMLAVIASVLEAVEKMDQGGKDESKRDKA